MQEIAVDMVRRNLDRIPVYALPGGFGLRLFRRGDEEMWARICSDSGLFVSLDAGLEDFHKEFAQRINDMERRCLFVVDEDSGTPIGTGIAWHDPDCGGADCGRVHWIGIAPEFQGRGLAKPMVAAVLNRMAELGHTRACLKTQTHRLRAIWVYLDLGFEPKVYSSEQEEGWAAVAEVMNHPALADYAGRSARGLESRRDADGS